MLTKEMIRLINEIEHGKNEQKRLQMIIDKHTAILIEVKENNRLMSVEYNRECDRYSVEVYNKRKQFNH